MGIWSIPNTDEAMSEVERVMSRPLGARVAGDMLFRLTGEGRLYDMIDKAAGRDAEADVRPLVAMLLDEWSNWTATEDLSPSWGSPLRDRARRLAEAFRDAHVSSLVPTAMPDEPDAAVAKVAAILDVRGPHGNRFMATRGHGPGVWAVLDCALDALFRVDVVHGQVEAAEPGLDRALKMSLFGVPSGTRH